MANAGIHREKAEKNRSFLDSIDEGSYPEWIATVAFYTGLHHVELLAAHLNRHFKGHKSRHKFLKAERPELWKDYRPLFNLSLVARYGSKSIKAVHVKQVRLHLERLEEATQTTADRLSQSGHAK